MKVLLQPALEAFAANDPRAVEKISRLHEAGVRVALASSGLAAIVAKTFGLQFRETDDTDLLVPNADLALAANLLGATIHTDKQISLESGRATLRYTVDEVTAHDANAVIQIVCPTTRVQCGDHWYDTVYTDAAAEARTVYKTEYGFVPIAPEDARFLYGVLQREGNGKTDSLSADILGLVCDPTDPYVAERAEEMNLDGRVWQFFERSGTLAVETSVLTAV